MSKNNAIPRPPKGKKVAASKLPVCFVIMPFGGWLDDYYQSIYSVAIKSAGLEPHRADDLFRPSTIVNDIWAYTKQAKVLLADLTGKNPNVFYELGLAHALGKPAVMVAESLDDIPFDLRGLRIIVYDKNSPRWGESLRDKIVSALREVMAAPVEAVLPAFLDVEAAGSKFVVSAERKDVVGIKQEIDLLRRELRERDVHMQSGISALPPGWPFPGPAYPLKSSSEARIAIAEMVKQGLSQRAIVEYLSRRAARPQGWTRFVQEEFDRLVQRKGTEPAPPPIRKTKGVPAKRVRSQATKSSKGKR